MSELDEIIETINRPIGPKDSSGFKIIDSHFENGRNLHSSQYYFARKFFSSSKNSSTLAKLLGEKIKDLKDTTLIGFRNYLGMVLEIATRNNIELNYSLIEQTDEGYVWHDEAELKSNLVLVLPVSCTCSAYFRLREFVFKSKAKKVSDSFFSLFTILDSQLESSLTSETQEISVDSLQEKKKNQYNTFRWTKITRSKIEIEDRDHAVIKGSIIVPLFAEFWLPDDCPFCFPELENKKLATERPIFPTIDNYETPNLIFGNPNMRRINDGGCNNGNTFTKVFIPNGQTSRSHIRGHLSVANVSYLNYIRGNNFFEENRQSILDCFEDFFKDFKSSATCKELKEIVFITSESKHNSSFLEELIATDVFNNVSTSILKFQASSELVDNFISRHFELLTDEHTIRVFFEEVMTMAGTFRLVSDAIKHAQNVKKKRFGDIHDTKGFDLIITLIDRMTPYCRDEVMGKLMCPDVKSPEERFKSFYRLNVPVISAEHLMNPINERRNFLEKMVNGCVVDQVKLSVAEAMRQNNPRRLRELDSSNYPNKKRSGDVASVYFPFQNNLEISEKLYTLYKPWFDSERRDLFVLYVTNVINDSLADLKGSGFKKVTDIIDPVKRTIEAEFPTFFIQEGSSDPDNDTTVESDLINDTIVKVLARPPLTFYETIRTKIFPYVLEIVEQKFEASLAKNSLDRFQDFRNLKFYVNRSIRLRSNFVISEKFLSRFKHHYSTQSWFTNTDTFRQMRSTVESTAGLEQGFKEAWLSSMNYVIGQIETSVSTLLFYLKELAISDPARSIHLERILNEKSVLPDNVGTGTEDLTHLINDPYYHFWGTLKSENIGVLKDLKTWYTDRPSNFDTNPENTLELVKEEIFGRDSCRSIEPFVRNANKLFAQSRHKDNPTKLDEIKRAATRMLIAAKSITKRLSPLESVSEGTPLQSLVKEIKEVFDKAVSIIGDNDSDVSYSLFVEFRPRDESTPDFDNVCSITSSETDDRPSAIKLSHDGFIYNLLYGLKSSTTGAIEHSILASFKIDNEWKCFNDKFLPNLDSDDRKVKDFKRLFDLDIKATEDSNPLGKSNMALFLRLAEFEADKFIDDKNSGLRGRAVLVVTSKKKATKVNFTNFLQIEKLRLLLLLKDDLLAFIRREFDNEAFVDIVQKRKQIKSQSEFSHGLDRYRDILSYAHKESVATWLLTSAKKREYSRLYATVDNAVKGQLFSLQLNHELSQDTAFYSKSQFAEVLKLLFQFKVEGWAMRPDQYQFVYNPRDPIQLPKLVFDSVLPELLINMKRKGGRDSHAYKIIVDSGSKLIFENGYSGTTPPNFDKEGGGLAMCRNFAERLGWTINPSHDPATRKVTVEITRIS